MHPVLKFFTATLFIGSLTFARENDTTMLLPIIPRPVYVQVNKDTLVLGNRITIRYTESDLHPEAEYLKEYLQNTYHLNPQIEESRQPAGSGITLSLARTPQQRTEGYTLHVDKNGVLISGDRAGLFYGIQTLIQLLPVEDSHGLTIPSLVIEDYPRFQWRGMHLDVGRHFFSVSFVKKYIDMIAMYKMNIFHWHLTEDQGWRIEIKKYPKLTQIGAYRSGSMIGPFSAQMFDSVRYGGSYTQDEIRDVVAYAARRHVMIVPEIEMPGHCMAALASYPEFSCTGGPF